jgi:hypothetical protein
MRDEIEAGIDQVKILGGAATNGWAVCDPETKKYRPLRSRVVKRAIFILAFLSHRDHLPWHALSMVRSVIPP